MLCNRASCKPLKSQFVISGLQVQLLSPAPKNNAQTMISNRLCVLFFAQNLSKRQNEHDNLTNNLTNQYFIFFISCNKYAGSLCETYLLAVVEKFLCPRMACTAVFSRPHSTILLPAGQRKNLKIWTKNIDKLLNRW